MSSLTPQQIAEIATNAAMAAVAAATEPEGDATTAKVLADAPTPTTQRKRDTTAKATAAAKPVKRDMTDVLIMNGKAKDHAGGAPVPSEGVAFVVTPTYGSNNSPRSNGAAVQAYRDGKPVKAWTQDVVRAFCAKGVANAIDQAIGKVDERALIGSHRPEVTS